MKNIGITLIFAAGIFINGCKSEKDDLAVEPAFVSMLDKNYYYLPEYETYYFPPTREWSFYAEEEGTWVTSQVVPIRLWNVKLGSVYKVQLDYIGLTPYEFHETYKAKYPSKNSSSKKEHKEKDKVTDTRNKNVHSSVLTVQTKKRYHLKK